MKLYLIISLLAVMACNSPKKQSQVISETFTVKRITELRNSDEYICDSSQNVKRIFLGLEFGMGPEAVETTLKSSSKITHSNDSLFSYVLQIPKNETFPELPEQITVLIKPYYYNDSLWKVELHEINSPARNELYNILNTNILSLIINNYFEKNSDLMLYTKMDIPSEETSFKIKDNLLIAVKSHSTQGVTIGYIDLYMQNKMLKNAAARLSADL